MGYLKAWRQNLATLGAAVIVIVAVVVSVLLTRGSPSVFGPGPGDRAMQVEFTVTGTAHGGIAVTEAAGGRGTNAQLLARKAHLPYRGSVAVNGSRFYEFQAQLLGDGAIRCTVRIGSVVDVKRAAGLHGTCSPAVSKNGGGRLGEGLPGWHGD